MVWKVFRPWAWRELRRRSRCNHRSSSSSLYESHDTISNVEGKSLEEIKEGLYRQDLKRQLADQEGVKARLKHKLSLLKTGAKTPQQMFRYNSNNFKAMFDAYKAERRSLAGLDEKSLPTRNKLKGYWVDPEVGKVGHTGPTDPSFVSAEWREMMYALVMKYSGRRRRLSLLAENA